MAQYGLDRPNSLPEAQQAQAANAVSELKAQGYTIVSGALHGSDLQSLRHLLELCLQKHEAACGGRDHLAELGEADTVRALMSIDARWSNLSQNERVQQLCKALIGDYFILHLQNGIFNRPDATHNQARWHRDLPYQNYVSSRPLAISALWCFDDFTEENGGTQVVPGSHQIEFAESEEWLAANAVTVTAAAGSIIVFDSMLMHRAGHNRSNAVRRAVNHVYTIPLIKQQIDLPRLLGDDYTDDAAYRKLLGYDSQVATDVTAFLNRKKGRS